MADNEDPNVTADPATGGPGATDAGGAAPAGGSDGATEGGVSPSSTSGAAGGGEGDGSGSGRSATPPSPPQQPDWRDKRIGQLTAQKKELEERIRQGVSAGAPAGAAAPPVPVPVSDNAVIEARANELAAQREFLRQCDELQRDGRATFGQADFDSRTNGLRQLIDPNNPAEAGAWNSLLVAARETGEGPRLLFELGANLNEAQRLLGLPPVRMAVELTKLAAKQAAAGDPPAGGSLAADGTPLPRPLRPIGGRGPSHQAISPDDPERSQNLDIATWMSRRQAQVKERGIR